MEKGRVRRERQGANEMMRGWEWQASQVKVAKLFSNGQLIAAK